MSDEHETSPELNAIEQALASFAPAAPRLDRDRLMFLAGQVGAHEVGGRRSEVGRAAWFWPASSATLAATSLALAIALFARPAPQPQLIVRDATAPPAVAPEPSVAVDERVATAPLRMATLAMNSPVKSGESYLKTRDVAFRMGLDALGRPTAGGSGVSPGTTYIELLEGLATPAAGPAASPAERSHNM
jgi:hypothetical protein